MHPWDGYLTGPENEFAMAAAQAIARGECDGISPLVIHGPSGVGKSRLLAGLVAERQRRQPGSSIAFLDVEAFITACLEATVAAGGVGWSALRGRFRAVDLFVLEDLHGLERSPLARDELVHTLDALEATNAAVVFSAHSAPATWPHHLWPRRLVNRLLGGLAASIASPSLISRRRYVLHQSSDNGIALEAEAVEMLAQAADGYRTLNGWILRLSLEARLESAPENSTRGQGGQRTKQPLQNAPRSYAIPLDLHTVTRILAQEAIVPERLLTVDTIARAVAEQFGIRLSVLRGPSRRASVVIARHLAMHVSRACTGLSFAAIGAYFGGRDAATVRHACKATTLRLDTDFTLAAAVAVLEPRKFRPIS